MDKEDVKEGSQTCHLCGKVQCGQRLGRVKCCQCGRIFCLQQLNRKFHIVAVANDPNFKCPRCTGICCCVCHCNKQHVHCKVYNVRANKLKKNNPEGGFPEPVVPRPIEPEQQVAQFADEGLYGVRSFPRDFSVSPARTEGLSSFWPESQGLWSYSNLDIPVQNSDGLTQLNLHILDNWEYNTPKNTNQNAQDNPHSKFSDDLSNYFKSWGDLPIDDRKKQESYLLRSANKLQLKAAKTDVLFNLLDTYNRNSIQVKVTWSLKNCISLRPNECTLPALYTIIKYYPTILFTLQNDSDYQEDMNSSTISITFMNTGAVKDTKSLCTCIALLDNSFRRFADVSVKEEWTDPKDMSFKTIGNIDQKILKDMIADAESQKQTMQESRNHRFISISYKRSKEETFFENLPLISLILRRVYNDHQDAIFSLWKMKCNNEEVECILEFSNDSDWENIIKKYESSIEVKDAFQKKIVRQNSQDLLMET